MHKSKNYGGGEIVERLGEQKVAPTYDDLAVSVPKTTRPRMRGSCLSYFLRNQITAI